MADLERLWLGLGELSVILFSFGVKTRGDAPSCRDITTVEKAYPSAPLSDILGDEQLILLYLW